jgi:hypothetical protein
MEEQPEHCRAKWRLCVSRPEIGFDFHWAWGDWASLVNYWWFDSQKSPGAPVPYYFEMSLDGQVEVFPLDVEWMEAQRKRVGLTTPQEREARIQSHRAVRRALGR